MHYEFDDSTYDDDEVKRVPCRAQVGLLADDKPLSNYFKNALQEEDEREHETNYSNVGIVNLSLLAEIVNSEKDRVEHDGEHNNVIEPNPLHEPHHLATKLALVSQTAERLWNSADEPVMHCELSREECLRPETHSLAELFVAAAAFF